MRRLRIPHRAAALVVGTAGLAGCGGSSGFTFNPSVVENAIQVGIAQQQHALTIVTCPVGVRAHTGGHFTCTVTFSDGTQSPVTVTELDAHGDVHYAGLRGYVNGHKRR